jgi:NDP-sugar pyrophosphorylase family protein
MDNVTLGDNVVLQNTIVGPRAVIGDNCGLNDCQVAAGKHVPSGTKEKGEVLVDTLTTVG